MRLEDDTNQYAVHLVMLLLCCCALKTVSSGDGPLNGSSSSRAEPRMSPKGIRAVACALAELLESVRPNAVGSARRSGFGSSGSAGGGVGSLGGGVGSRCLRTGYFLGADVADGETFSFASCEIVRRSNALRVPFTPGALLVFEAAAAFFLRSSASFASFEEPPRSLGRGRLNAGARHAAVSGGCRQGTPSNQSFGSSELSETAEHVSALLSMPG